MENSHAPPLVITAKKRTDTSRSGVKPVYIVLIVVGSVLVLVAQATAAYFLLTWDSSPKTARDTSASAASSVPWTPPPKPHLRLSYKWSSGTLISHDLYVTNSSGKDLTEVHLKVTFVGEDASPTVERYWSSWTLGETRDVEISVDKVHRIQALSIAGSADEGVFSDELGITSR